MFRALSFLAAMVFAASSATAQIEESCEAHGGLGTWRSFGQARFDLTWKSPKATLKDTHLFDLVTRRGLIVSESYKHGVSEGGEVWVSPNAEALGGRPPRFYMWTPLYFFGMPFVLADRGAKHEALGRKSFRDAEYDAVKVTFEKGVGDTPDDYYVAYIEPDSRRLKLVYYIVTYASLQKDRPLSELEEHALIFDEWQPVDELLVPKTATIYDWKDGAAHGDPLGTLEFSNVDLAAERPDASVFEKPDGAVIDTSHEAPPAK